MSLLQFLMQLSEGEQEADKEQRRLQILDQRQHQDEATSREPNEERVEHMVIVKDIGTIVHIMRALPNLRREQSSH